MQKKNYDWRCHVCDARNDANAHTCAICSFPAEASGKRIEEARMARNHELASLANQKGLPSDGEGMMDILKPLNPVRKLTAILGMAIGAVGIIGAKFAFTWTGIILAISVLVGGIIIFCVAVAGADDVSRNNIEHD